MESDAVLTIRGLSMTFPGVKALDNVDFTLRRGEIHALMGENGAGKSTLIKCLTGINAFEAGEIHVDGIEGPVVNHSTLDAQEKGISTVYQEINLCPNLSVAENLFVGRQPRTKLGLIDKKAMIARAKVLMDELDIKIDVSQNLENYSIAIQQMIAIARAVDMDCRILILDEPTSSLDDNEVEKLFALMRQLRDKGVGIIFVTHFLEQVYAVCDRITVLRNGTLVGEYLVSELPKVKLVSAMLGKDLDDLSAIKPKDWSEHFGGEEMLAAEQLAHAGTIKPFDFRIHKGEVVGLAGLLGSGRSEMVRAIYGADRPSSGVLKVKGSTVSVKKPIDAMANGMGYLPDDRKGAGIIADLSVRDNIMLAMQSKRGMLRKIPKATQEELADKYINMLSIKTPSPETPVSQLSGGNQQKVILARWLATNADFLILDEPTRGIDVGTKAEIQKLILKLAEEGKSIVFISSEIEEMLRTCTRMAILRDGEKVSELTSDLSVANVMKTIAGGAENAEN